MGTRVRGECLCSSVAFSIEGPFRGFQYCHCTRCRKQSGSAHVANVFVPPEQFRWERGESEVQRYDLPGTKYWCTAFCKRCGSPMPWLNKPGTAFVVAAGALDGDPGARPSSVVYFASRAPWYIPSSMLEMHEGSPNQGPPEA